MTVVPQHMQALKKGNQIRHAIAETKRDIRSLPTREGADLAADVIENDWDDPKLGRAHVDEVLLSVHRLGRPAVLRCLRLAGVGDPAKRLRELTPRQRKAVAAQLRLWAAGYGS